MLRTTSLFACTAGALGLSFLVGLSSGAPPAPPPTPVPPKAGPPSDPPDAPLPPGGKLQSVDKLPARKAPETTQLSGTVVDTAKVSFGDSREKHLVAWLRTDEGDIRPVDLGPAAGEKAVSVNRGQQITVTGQIFPVVQTRRTRMFFATEVSNGQSSLPIPRPQPPAGQANNAPAAPPKPPAEPDEEPFQTISGEILKTKKVEWRNSDRRELVLMLRAENGREVVADLGPTTAFQGAGVRSGRDIVLYGQYRKLGDHKVFFASQAIYGDKTIDIKRADSAKANAPSKPENRHVLEGTISGIHDATRKDGVKHMVVLLRGDDDRYAMADLGEADDARKYDLVLGERITVSGPVIHVKDRPVIVASSLSINGTTHWINRK